MLGLSDFLDLTDITFYYVVSVGAIKNTSSVFVINVPPSPIPNHVPVGKHAINSIYGTGSRSSALIDKV